MHPDWPFMPTEDDKETFTQLNLPFDYHFYYRILDGDEKGQPGKKGGKRNPDFNLNKTKSCLQLLAEYSTSEVLFNVFCSIWL